MTITLELPKRLERKLSSEAARLGLPLEQYALRLLGDQGTERPRPTNGAELVEYWRQEGVIGSRHDLTDSSSYGRRIRHGAKAAVTELERRYGGG